MFSLKEADLRDIDNAVKEFPLESQALRDEAKAGIAVCLQQFKSNINSLLSSLALRGAGIGPVAPGAEAAGWSHQNYFISTCVVE